MSIVNTTNATTDVLAEFRAKQDDKANGSDDLGKNEFMELMIAQLKNQNPLEPKGNGQFIADLAQFSSLEEMQNLSSTVDSVVGEFRSTQALQAAAYTLPRRSLDEAEREICESPRGSSPTIGGTSNGEGK
jgi:flagellar basal-body rod modification protein FlgD